MLLEKPYAIGAFSAALLAMIALATGCGSKRNLTHPVSGKITWDDGRPLTTGGVVMFTCISEDGKSQQTAMGAIGEDGTYRLTTFKQDDGAIVGKHQVLVRAKRPPSQGGEFAPRPPSPIDSKFESYETSGLNLTVQPGDNVFDIVVTKP